MFYKSFLSMTSTGFCIFYFFFFHIIYLKFGFGKNKIVNYLIIYRFKLNYLDLHLFIIINNDI